MVKYKASTGTPRIETVDVDKETKSSVWVNGDRRKKKTDYESYFDTWDDAKAHLLEYFEQRCDRARRSLEFANRILDEAKGLKKP